MLDINASPHALTSEWSVFTIMKRFHNNESTPYQRSKKTEIAVVVVLIVVPVLITILIIFLLYQQKGSKVIENQ